MRTVFLDRDGVISTFTPNDYHKSWEEFQFIPDAIEALKILCDNGFRIVIISNQAGVNRGVFTLKALNHITEKMEEELGRRGVEISKIYYCIHAPEENCECRKPKTGLFLRAQKELEGLKDLNKTFFVGDAETDMQTGKAAGTKTILVLSGKTKNAEETKEWEFKPDYIAEDLMRAVEIILDFSGDTE